MALQTEGHLRVERQIVLVVGAVQLVAGQTVHRAACFRVDDIFADRVRDFVRSDVAVGTKANVDPLQHILAVRTVRSVAVGTIHTVMCHVSVMFLRIILTLEVTIEAHPFLLTFDQCRLVGCMRIVAINTGVFHFKVLVIGQLHIPRNAAMALFAEIGNFTAERKITCADLRMAGFAIPGFEWRMLVGAKQTRDLR